MIRTPESVAIRLADALSVPDGGFTITPSSLTDVRAGYAVSPYPQFEYCIAGVVTPDDVGRYLSEHAAILAQPRALFGGWRNPDDGLAYLDLSIIIPDRSQALVLAKAAGQSAIWDFAARESIAVDGEVWPGVHACDLTSLRQPVSEGT